MLFQKVDTVRSCGTDRIAIGPVEIMRLDREAAIGMIRSAVLQHSPTDIAICNAHTLLTALDDPAYAEVLQSMTLLNDGIGTNLASRYLYGEAFPENLNGTDFIPNMLGSIGIPLKIYLLGAGENEVQRARQKIEESFPTHTVVGIRNGYFSEAEIPSICAEITGSGADLLLCGMGNPRQEKFIHANRSLIGTPVTIGVGALFDFMAGKVARAPKAVQAVGLEWLFRLLQEPRRLARRYLVGIPRFLWALRRLKSSGARAAR